MQSFQRGEGFSKHCHRIDSNHLDVDKGCLSCDAWRLGVARSSALMRSISGLAVRPSDPTPLHPPRIANLGVGLSGSRGNLPEGSRGLYAPCPPLCGRVQGR